MVNNKKGFTLVELVIVIAVIAILAGVLIGTFASVLKRANDSAEIQRVKSEELAVKADDILKKIEDSNWYGWADFENSIVEKISKTVADKTTTFDDVAMKKAIKEALVEYGVKTGNDYSTLTEDQVKAIVENALGTLKYEGVTEDQVRAIVYAAVTSVSANQLTAAQVRAIVNAANTNNLTQAQVAAIVANALSTTDGELSAKIDAAVAALKVEINGIVPLTEEDVEEIITRLVPVTKPATSAEEFTTLYTTLQSGSTILLTGDILDDNLTLSTTDYITLCIKANEPYSGTLTINAENATIYLIGDFSQATIDVVAVDGSSLHINGKVGTLTVNKGRAVVEEGSTVTNLVAAPSANSTVKVVVDENAKIDRLTAEYQKNGNNTNDYIVVENNGSIQRADLVLSDMGTGSITTNVVVNNGAKADDFQYQTGDFVDRTDETTDLTGVSVYVDGQGYEVQDGKIYSISETATNEARIGTVEYLTVEMALAAANSGDIVEVISNAEIDTAFNYITTDITLTNVNNTQLTLNTPNKYSIWVIGNGKLTLEDVNIYQSGLYGIEAFSLDGSVNPVINFISGTWTSGNSSYYMIGNYNGFINIFDGTFDARKNCAIVNNFSEDSSGIEKYLNGVVNIYGGTLINNNYYAIQGGNTVINIYGGTIQTYWTFNTGTLNIYDGTFISGDQSPFYCAAYLNIYGGTFNYNNGVIVVEPDENTKITGGTFSSDPSSYVDDSLYDIDSTSTPGKWIVTAKGV